ncbi:MAG: CdaR family protein, partial [Oscillospiraceae bacterium]
EDIKVENIDEDLTVDSVGAVTVTVYGNSESIKSMTKGMVKVSVDLDGYNAGSHNVNVDVKTYTDNITTKVYPEKVKVVLK